MKRLMGKSFLLFSVSVIVMEGNGCEGHATRSCQFFYAHLLSARFSFFFFQHSLRRMCTVSQLSWNILLIALLLPKLCLFSSR